jgi:hypothetical protein
MKAGGLMNIDPNIRAMWLNDLDKADKTEEILNRMQPGTKIEVAITANAQLVKQEDGFWKATGIFGSMFLDEIKDAKILGFLYANKIIRVTEPGDES